MEEKVAHGEPFTTTRALVNFVNDNNIRQEDIVSVLSVKGELILIYYQ